MFLVVQKALGLFLLPGFFIITTMGTEEGVCIVRRTRQGIDRIFPRVSDSTSCTDRNFCTSLYNAAPTTGDGICTCACSGKNSTFNENTGTCVANSAIRNAGCASNIVYFFKESGSSDPVKVLINTSAASLRFGDRSYKDCTVDARTSKYFTRNGSWMEIKSSLGGEFPFTVQQTRKFQNLKWNQQPSSALFGHIIKLDINCKKRNGRPKLGCLIFKVRGAVRVPCIIPSTKQPPVVSTRSPSSTTVPVTRDPTSEQHVKHSESTAVVNALTTLQTTTSNEGTETNAPALHRTGTQLPVSLIIAVAVAVTAVAVACIAGLLFLVWRRKRKHRDGRRAGNPTYTAADTLPLHEITDEPVYATVSSPKHLYQPLTLERSAPKAYQTLVKQPAEDPSGYLEPVEGVARNDEHGYAYPEEVIDDGGTKPESARYASVDDLGCVTDDGVSPLDPSSPPYCVLEGPAVEPHSPSSQENPETPSDSVPSSPPPYLDLLGPDCVA